MSLKKNCSFVKNSSFIKTRTVPSKKKRTVPLQTNNPIEKLHLFSLGTVLFLEEHERTVLSFLNGTVLF